MRDRIRKLLEHLKMTPAEFADSLEVPRSSVSHILSGRNNPSLEFLRKMLLAYPEISTDWLIMGQGGIKREKPESTGEKVIKMEKVPEEDIELSLSAVLDGNSGESKPGQHFRNKRNRERETPPVEKIIILFSDGTFSEYRPADKS